MVTGRRIRVSAKQSRIVLDCVQVHGNVLSDEPAPKRSSPDLGTTRSGMHAYICGLDKMVKANRELLKGLGRDRTSIRYEKHD